MTADYVIIGSGSAGSAMAYRLGEAGKKVVVIEQGGSDRGPFIQMPGAGWDKIDPAGIPPGVLVANCYEHERAMAEWTMMMCIALSRKLLEADRTIRMGVWRLFPAIGHPLYPELGSRTIG